MENAIQREQQGEHVAAVQGEGDQVGAEERRQDRRRAGRRPGEEHVGGREHRRERNRRRGPAHLLRVLEDALDVLAPGLTVDRAAMPARWDWPLNAPVKLRVNAVEAAWNPDPKSPRLPAQAVPRSKPAQPVTLVPYGCTKFRIAMFPVAAAP